MPGLLFVRGVIAAWGSDAVAGLEAGAGDGRADGGGIVDVGGFDDADRRGEAANDGAGRRVLDLLGDAHDLELVADLDAGLLRRR